MERQWKKFRNRSKIEFIKKQEKEKIIKWQYKLTFSGVHKSYEKYDSFMFKQSEVLIDKPIHLGIAILELSKMSMYEFFYDKFQLNFGEENF